MKTGLKRIEATLHDLGNRSNEAGDAVKSSFSFRISVGAKEATASKETSSEKTSTEANEDGVEENLFAEHQSVQTFPAQEIGGKTPSLPKFKTPSFSSHRHAANPALAMNILQEIQEHIAG